MYSNLDKINILLARILELLYSVNARLNRNSTTLSFKIINFATTN